MICNYCLLKKKISVVENMLTLNYQRTTDNMNCKKIWKKGYTNLVLDNNSETVLNKYAITTFPSKGTVG